MAEISPTSDGFPRVRSRTLLESQKLLQTIKDLDMTYDAHSNARDLDSPAQSYL